MPVKKSVNVVMAKVGVGKMGMWLEEVQIGLLPKERLVEEPKGVFKSALNFANALKKRGFELLGQGCFSMVYAKKDSDKVIKVTYRPDNWIDYVTWAAEKGYAGTYAPKVYSYKKFPAGFSVAVMERMAKPARNSYDEDDYVIQCLLTPALRGNKMAQLYLDDYSPGLPKFLIDFWDKWKDSRFDMYGDNMMFRKDGTFCVTDPLAGKSTLTKTRLRSRDFGPSPVRIYYEAKHFNFG
jgi:hypothetical protein